MLKLQLTEEADAWRESVNIAALSERLGLSRTPVREALFRFLGEGVLETVGHAGYRLFRPDTEQLRDLYVWTRHLLLGAAGLVPQDRLKHMVDALLDRSIAPDRLPDLLFQNIADATRNREFSRQAQIALDRLIVAHAAEMRFFADAASEARHLLAIRSVHVLGNLSRRIDAYFARRIRHCSGIVAQISADS